MTKCLMVKGIGSLRPADEMAEEALHHIKLGDVVRVEIKKARVLGHHKKFFALMQLVYKNLDERVYPSLDDFVDAVKLVVGHRKRIELPGGKSAWVPKSISFSAMDQTEFDDFYNRVCDAICLYFIPGLTNEALQREVEEMIAGAEQRG